jgi:hypothetical protein
MRKGLCVLVLGFLLGVCMPGPAAAEVTLDLGVKGGISLAKAVWVDEGLEDPSTLLLQPVIGAFVSFNVSKAFALQPEVYFLTRGGEWTEEGPETTTKWVEKWGYVHIPVLAKLRLKPGSKTVPVLFVGPALNFNLSASGKIYEDDVLVDEYEFAEYVKSPTWSFVFGGGAEIRMNKLLLVFDVRYDLGLTNPITYIDEEVKLGTWMVMVGIGF